MVHIGNDWDSLLKEEFNKPYFNCIEKEINELYEQSTVYPPKDKIFACLKHTAYKNVNVVIIGQDPYHQEGQANGLCFSVNEGVKIPPSLKNIFKELQEDLDLPKIISGDLTKWAKQGVLLLNSTLTVEKGNANSHKNLGWERFTDKIISLINDKDSPVVFMLWGNFAKKKAKLITNPLHLILSAPHPSPLSAYHGFFGCGHFSKAKDFLNSQDMKIDFSL